jgi:hypothetical protein
MKRVIISIGILVVVSSSHSMDKKRQFNFKAFFEKRDSTGKTYLHHAIKSGNAKRWQSGDLNDEVPSTEYLHNILATNAQLIAYIIQAGVNVNIFDKKRRTPLFYAAKYKNEAAVKLLLEAGADPNIRNREGIPPLVIACSIEDNAVIITMLLKGGAWFRDLSERIPYGLANSFTSEDKGETILESALKTCPVNAVALLQYKMDASPALRSSQNIVGPALLKQVMDDSPAQKPTANKKGNSFGAPSYSFLAKLNRVPLLPHELQGDR